MSGSKNVNKNSTNLYCGCVLSFCESKCSQSCGVVSTRSAFCWSLSVTHTQRQPITSTLTTHTPLSVWLSLSPSLSVCLLPLRSYLLTAAPSLHPSAKRSGSKNLPSSSSSLPLCVFSFLLLGHTSSASQRSTGKASSVSLNSCNKQMHTRTADITSCIAYTTHAFLPQRKCLIISLLAYHSKAKDQKIIKKKHTPDVEQKTQKVCGTFGSTEVFCMCWIHLIWASVLEEKKSKTGSYP